MLRLWNINQDALNKVFEELQQRLGPAMDSQTHRARGPALFAEILSEGTVFPLGLTEKEAVERRIGEEMNRFLEETWIHRPLKSLNGIPPIDAAGHAGLRKKLTGVVSSSARARPWGITRAKWKVCGGKLGFPGG